MTAAVQAAAKSAASAATRAAQHVACLLPVYESALIECELTLMHDADAGSGNW